MLFLVLITSSVIAQVEFVAKASKQKLGVNERLRIDFEMNQDGDNFVPPSFNNFTVIGSNESANRFGLLSVGCHLTSYEHPVASRGVNVANYKLGTENGTSASIDRTQILTGSCYPTSGLVAFYKLIAREAGSGAAVVNLSFERADR